MVQGRIDGLVIAQKIQSTHYAERQSQNEKLEYILL